MRVPDFSLSNQFGETKKLSEHFAPRVKQVLLFTFTEAGSPTCTQTCLNVLEHANEFKKHHILPVGLCLSKEKKLSNFDAKHSISFPLLSDPNHEVIEKLGFWTLKKRFGREYHGVQRALLLIDPSLKVGISSIEPKSKESAQSILQQIADNKA